MKQRCMFVALAIIPIFNDRLNFHDDSAAVVDRLRGASR